jgi:hypothetical protein
MLHANGDREIFGSASVDYLMYLGYVLKCAVDVDFESNDRIDQSYKQKYCDWREHSP